jgi:hypothetical protein
MADVKSVFVFCYTPTCAGIGDFLRAAGFMYDICIQKGIEFHLDITNPIHHFFTYKKYDGGTDVSGFKHVALRNPSGDDVTAFINGLPYTENIAYRSNYTGSFTPHIVTQLRAILNPTPAILVDLHAQMDMIGIRSGEYTCVHIRYGDIVFAGNRHTWDNRAGDDTELLQCRIAKAFELRKDPSKPTLIISDNYAAKVALSRQYGCPLLDIQPVHTSFTSDIAAVHDTVIEFLILAHAAEVLSVTRSGFPLWAAAYGGVPNTEVWKLVPKM